MASPFKFFRKHQTELLVVIGLLTMVAFIILPSVLQQLEVIGRSRTSSNVVETKKYGSLSTYDAQRIKDSQRYLNGFFSRVANAYQVKINELQAQKSDQKKLTEMSINGYRAQRLAQQFNNDNVSNENVVFWWLLENKAKEMGFSINDATISAFISECTAGLDKTTVDQLIYGNDNQSRASAENTLFNALNGLLLRQKAMGILSFPWNICTTGEKFDYFCRLNQRANVELFPVKVEDFVSMVAEPSEAEIKKFFEEYKDKDANIESSEPGLRQPQKIVLEYCYASYEQFMNTDAITDEQIQKNYDENKENYVIEKKEGEEQKNDLGQLPSMTVKGLDGKEYRALDDKLKEEIRQSLAIVEAKSQIDKAIGVVQSAMNEYANARDDYELSADKDKNAVPPKEVDLASLAEKNKLKYEKTTLLTQLSFPETRLGKLRLKDVDRFVDAASEFYGNTPLYQGKIFENSQLNNEEYIVWKIQDVAEHTPAFDEEGIKQQVVDQLKFIEARKLAEKEAQNKVQKAIKDQLPLKSCLGEDAFVPPQFTWMTSLVYNPNMEPYIVPTPIEKVQGAGFDFRSSLFQMKAGEIKSIVNESQSVYYVVRMIELTPSEQLYSRFCVTPEYEYVSVRNFDYELFNRDLYESLEKEAGLKWIVQSDDNADR